jgi:hypothetical protein
MPKRHPLLTTVAWPAEPDLSALPVRVDRRTGAALLARYFFPCSPRTLEAWPIRWRRVNGRALVETAELFALARGKLDEAPAVLGGRKPAGATASITSHAA